MNLDDTISAIVTGGASGLGFATARVLIAAGARVAIFDVSDDGADRAAEIGARFVKVDITSDDSVQNGLDETRAAQGVERILVNCAGIAPPARVISKGQSHLMSLFEEVISVNLSGTFRMVSRCAAAMAGLEPMADTGERGVIVNTASVAAFDGQIGQAAYAASKAAIAGMTLPIARDLAQSAIRVCSIAPGIFGTPLLKGLPDHAQESLGKQVPFPSRLGDPDEFAGLVLHIIRNGYLNGEVIRLDGAIRMAPR
ncbi:SDR family NAD(P)-dependent oxidoreductase [Mesorhizobium sp. 1B3]|uniref:SDR family NAD(P)-dependent oxidoreductase n=1 Tax=Mesorhizobium sp. 1B3 TaxID=3243599 RepID=UPI003D983DC6